MKLTTKIYLIGIGLMLGGALLIDCKILCTGTIALFLGFAAILVGPLAAQIIEN